MQSDAGGGEHSLYALKVQTVHDVLAVADPVPASRTSPNRFHPPTPVARAHRALKQRRCRRWAEVSWPLRPGASQRRLAVTVLLGPGGRVSGFACPALITCADLPRVGSLINHPLLPRRVRQDIDGRAGRAWLVDVHPCCWSLSNPSRRRSSANSNSNWSSQPEPTTDSSSWVAALAISAT